jgi:hypothetical protein
MKSEEPPSNERRITAVERIAAGMLLAVVLLLGWMIVRAYHPEWGQLAPTEVEVAVTLVVLLSSLLLVSVVALSQPRS